MDVAPVEIEGLRELRRGLRSVERSAPRELNKQLVRALEPVELVASARTPRGVSGDLQASNRLATSGDVIKLINTQPYANANHWGRNYWPNQRHARRTPSKVTAKRWLYDTLMEQRPFITRTVDTELDRFIQRQIT